MEMNNFSRELFLQRYAFPGETTWEELAHRVSAHVASAEANGEIPVWKDKFFEAIDSGDFIPGGRILYGSGRRIGALLNCFSLGVDDDRFSIAQLSYDMYIISTYGGGVGICYDAIRPKGAPIQAIDGAAPGVVSEITKIDAIGGEVVSGGSRRVALLALLSIEHPDVLEFINVKTQLHRLNNHNISVGITRDFIKAIKKNKEWTFTFGNRDYKMWKFLRRNPDGRRKEEEVLVPGVTAEKALITAENHWKTHFNDEFELLGKEKVMARDLWSLIISNNIQSGEPGFLFVDNIKDNFPNYIGSFNSTNPCQPDFATVLTPDGIRTFADIDVGSTIWSGDVWTSVINKVATGIKKVYEYETDHGSFIGTKNHKIVQEGKKVEVEKARSIDRANTPFSSKESNPSENFTSPIKTKRHLGEFPVYDITVDDPKHTYWSGGCLVANCGEVVGERDASCCLGSINLFNFYNEKTNDVDWSRLGKTIRIAVRFLDDVLTVNHYPTSATKEAASRGRRIGMGITGLAYLLISLGFRYGSKKSIEFLERLFATVRNEAYEASIELAKEKGAFPAFNLEKHLDNPYLQKLPARLIRRMKKYGLRNVALLTIPPTGTTSMVAGISTGIEPIFAPVYLRKFRKNNTMHEELVLDRLFAEYLKEGKDTSAFVGANEIAPEEHLEIQVAAQAHIDNSISKTILVPEDYTSEQLEELLLDFVDHLKGVTIFRSGSREGAPLQPVSIDQFTQEELLETAAKYTVSSDDNCRNGTCDL